MTWQVVVCLDVRARAINNQGEMATRCWRFGPVPFPATEPPAKRRRGHSTVHCINVPMIVLARIHPFAISVHPSIHASSWQRASKQIYGSMHQRSESQKCENRWIANVGSTLSVSIGNCCLGSCSPSLFSIFIILWIAPFFCLDSSWCPPPVFS